MADESLTAEVLTNKYNELKPRYDKMGKGLEKDLIEFTSELGKDIISITYRVKEKDSFLGKVARKRDKYTDPFSDIEDFCGLRIVCFYESQLKTISDIIESKFDIVRKPEDRGPSREDTFGYRSTHFVVKLKPDQLKTEAYKGLDGLKAEIQVRTILMHAWADLSHKLSYKNENETPKQMIRKINQLSAILEVADERFDTLREAKAEYQKELAAKAAKDKTFFRSLPLNSDSLQVLMDFYLPNVEKTTPQGMTNFLGRLERGGVSINQLIDGLEIPGLASLVQDKYSVFKNFKYNQLTIIDVILCVTDDAWWARDSTSSSGWMVNTVNDLREKIGMKRRS